MTSKKSLFNFGIYKNTIKRFKWGSFLYAIALFFSVPFVFMVNGAEKYNEMYPFYEPCLLITEEYFVFPFLLAVCVPTVVAVLVYRFVHSQKQGIAVHSLPITRKENYFSTVVASFSLMFAPVVLNAIILLFMSLLGYGKIFSVACVVYWFFENCAILFAMFSVSSFCAFITGHPASHIVINAFLQAVGLIVGFCIYIISDVFLYGFYATETFLGNILIERTPAAWFYNTIGTYEFFKNFYIWVILAFSVFFYILSYVLYKKRKIENSGDIVAFKIFKPIFKYGIVASIAVVIFGIAKNSANLETLPTIVLIVAFTLISYFAIEMLMNKSFKVFKFYKGYLGFLGALAICTLFFAYTSVFGYETRIPDSDKIVKAGVFSYYNGSEIPIVIDEKIAENVREIHKELINDKVVSKSKKDYYNYSYVYVTYQLENGKTLKRYYQVTPKQEEKYLRKMYESEKYKLKMEGIDNINIENVKKLSCSMYAPAFSYSFVLNNEEATTLLKNLEKDIKEMDYDALQKDSYAVSFNIYTELTSKENKTEKVFKRVDYNDDNNVMTFQMGITSRFKNSYNYLKELGYCDVFVEETKEYVGLCKVPFTVKNETKSTGNNVTSQYNWEKGEYEITEPYCTYKGDEGRIGNFSVSSKDMVILDEEDAKKVLYSLFETKSEETPDGEYYGIYILKDMNGSDFGLVSYAAVFEKNNLPDYLKTYLQR